eukprot:g5148.t1
MIRGKTSIKLLKEYWGKHCTQQQLHHALSPSGIPAHHVFGYLSLWERTRILQEELGIRFARQVRNLVRLPYGMPHLRDVKKATDLHIKSFEDILGFPQPSSDEDVRRFLDLMDSIVMDHENIETELMSGLQGLFEDPFVEPTEVNDWMDSFFTLRIGIRTLITQHTAMVRGQPSIVSACRVKQSVRDSIQHTREAAGEVYEAVPAIVFENDAGSEIVTPYIRSYFEYVLTELLKNSIVAHEANDKTDDPIMVMVAEGRTAITIKISDRGAGFAIDKLPQMMYFGYSTEPVEICEEFEIASVPIFSGFGYGLPMARLFIKYLGGSLRILPVENVGTDVYVYIPKTSALRETLSLGDSLR